MTTDFGDAAKKVSRLKRELKDQHEQATENSMGRMQTEVRAEIRRNDSLARRILVSDVQEDPRPTSLLVERSVHVPGWSKYLEHGTGSRARQDTLPDHTQYPSPSPGPPLEPIETWVTAKHLTSSSREYDDPERLARAIQASIGALGTFPHPFLRPAWFGTYGYRNVIRANKQGMRTALRRSF